ncbi:MAG: hypothetical protein QF689_15175 [Candidatus Latescibacteria bacterium]|nr:hypothetical protein [Gemmatimonadaceae bacterium]MDP6019305.1 hypothetical protein [Candidatus Latescibacterota bacterium]MDP7449933.1 hypothetical protein [Candidatus Latescibacterota bacterium]HJP31749.1 hypothetical protein [Candidatus Latescibacterota bacterium]
MSERQAPVDMNEASRAAGHEITDADAAPLAKAGIFLAGLMLFAFVAMVIMFRTLAYVQPIYEGTEEPHPLSDTRAVVSGPRLQPDPPREKAQLRQSEDDLLTSYAWVDRENRVARIPIDRAIEVLAATGLPQTTGSGAASD